MNTEIDVRTEIGVREWAIEQALPYAYDGTATKDRTEIVLRMAEAFEGFVIRKNK